jgi:hypothetical protein
MTPGMVLHGSSKSLPYRRLQSALGGSLPPNQLGPSLIMDGATNDEYIHTVAIKLSRAMNLPVANDLLARNVIAMATSSNNSAGFIQG